jgi:hypothetical protein
MSVSSGDALPTNVSLEPILVSFRAQGLGFRVETASRADPDLLQNLKLAPVQVWTATRNRQ